MCYAYLYPIDVPGNPCEKAGEICTTVDLYEVIKAISWVKAADEWIVLGKCCNNLLNILEFVKVI